MSEFLIYQNKYDKTKLSVMRVNRVVRLFRTTRVDGRSVMNWRQLVW